MGRDDAVDERDKKMTNCKHNTNREHCTNSALSHGLCHTHSCKLCGQDTYSLGLCSAHYQRKRRAERQPDTEVEPHTFAMSYSEIAAELGISRQAVQQIEQRALAKIKAGGGLDDWKPGC